MGWLIGGGIAALLFLLGKRQGPATVSSVPDVTQMGAPVSRYARSGTSGPGLGLTLGAAGVRQCCGTAPISTLADGLVSPSSAPLSQVYQAAPAQTTVQLRPVTPSGTPGRPTVATGRYITRLGVRTVALPR
jgi:hypothetical protein